VAYRRTPRVQARLDAQRLALVAAAAEILGESGYAGCSVSAVAARAGVAAGSVYTHFGSKADLAAEVFRTLAEAEVDAVRNAARSGPPVDRILAVIDTFAGRALRAPRRAYALLAEPVDPAVDRLRLDFRRAFRDVLSDAVAAGVATGDLPPQDCTVAAAALVGAIAEALTGPLVEGVPSREIVPRLAEFAVRAVGGRVHADA
jgi:AcrR family transcriptional regulator